MMLINHERNRIMLLMVNNMPMGLAKIEQNRPKMRLQLISSQSFTYRRSTLVSLFGMKLGDNEG